MPNLSTNLPAAIERKLDAGAALAISISGGKDSQAMALALVALHRERGWKGEVFAIHADLGRIEWPESAAHVERIAELAGIELVVVRRKDGRDMLDHWRARGDRMRSQGKQARPWSDSKNRFCTSDMKRDPIDAYLRRFTNVVCAVGIRAQESAGRAKQPEWATRRIDNSVRSALTWHPILAWTITDVLAQCGHSWWDMRQRQLAYADGRTAQALDGWALHPAYVYGNDRLSCQFCVLGSLNDLRNGAQHRPELLAELVGMEREYGFTFKTDRSLASLAQAA